MAPNSPLPSIVAENLCKRYGHRFALRGLNLRLEPGEFVTLFGPNGAGKTTLVRVLAGLVRPTSGNVRIDDVPLERAEDSVRRKIGVISHQTFLYPNLSARENLLFYGMLFDVEALEDRIAELLDEVGLTARRDSIVRTFSRGMSQRLAIARAILHRPLIVLLDEPFSGLDPHAADILTRLLRKLHNGQRTLLMTTHNLEQGIELSQRFAIQVRGRIVYQAPSDSLDLAGMRRKYADLLQASSPSSPHVEQT